MAESIFRYPGGKLKALKFINPFWQQIEHDEYREPFVGGGSVYIHKPNVQFNWINDLDKDLYSFYKIICKVNDREELIKELIKEKINKKNHNKLYYSKPKTNYERAYRFYILNRCSFSGITKWNSFIGDVRYNIKRAQKLINLVGEKLKKTKITNSDFEKVILEKPKGKKVFLFLDPPYAESRQVAAYNVHFEQNDHERLAKLLKQTNHPFLLTYDDCEYIRKLYKWANFYDHTWTYSVANSKVHHNPRESGNELFISNFKLKSINQNLKLI